MRPHERNGAIRENGVPGLPAGIEFKGGEMGREIFRRALIAVAIVLVVAYLCDYIALRIRMARGGANAGLDQVAVLYGTPLKDGRVEVFADQPQTQTCVLAIFPHLGYSPCWYVRQHANKLVEENLPGGGNGNYCAPGSVVTAAADFSSGRRARIKAST
jgi:hypothetical protein